MHEHGIDEEDIGQHPDLEALLEHLGRVELKPAFLMDRLQRVIQELLSGQGPFPLRCARAVPGVAAGTHCSAVYKWGRLLLSLH